MTIKDLKDLTKLVQLCRKSGVATIEIDNIKITMGKDSKSTVQPRSLLEDAFPEANIPVPQYNPVVRTGNVENNDDIKTDMPTQDQLLNWSVRDENTGAN